MYTQEITRTHRTAFVIAIDQSSSMQESVVVNSRRMTKAVRYRCDRFRLGKT